MKQDDAWVLISLRRHITDFIEIGLETGALQDQQTNKMTYGPIWLDNNKYVVKLELKPV